VTDRAPHPDYRKRLLKALAEMDQGITESNSILADAPLSDEDRATVDYLRGLLVESRGDVEGTLKTE
jgi:ferritin